jgi:hypothetical protein
MSAQDDTAICKQGVRSSSFQPGTRIITALLFHSRFLAPDQVRMTAWDSGDTPRSVTRLPVDRLAHQIGVPVVSRVLLDHVHQDPP